MSEKPNNVVVGVAGQRVFVKVQGRGIAQTSQPFCQFSHEIIQRGFHEFIVDLADCSYLDSTFLGVLAGVGVRLMPVDGRIHLANLNPRCREVVMSLGLDQLPTVDMCDVNLDAPPNGSRVAPPAALQPLVAVQGAPQDAESKARCAKMMIEAHRTLMEIDPRNVPKFKDCVRFLTEDLERIRAGRQSSTP